MPLQLEIVSDHREIVGDDAVREFHDEGGTIGRSFDNDWILPDPDRYISGKHAAIDVRGGIYYLIDLSSNGVYLNDEHEPIGKGNPQRLFNGDRLRMGDFEITVSISEGESIVMPLEEEQTELPEPIDLPVAEAETLKTGMELLDEELITGDSDFQSRLYDGDEPSIVVEEQFPVDEHVEVPPVIQPVRVEASSNELFDTFLEGLGVNRADLHPTTDPAEVMQNAGEVLKEFVEGITKLLASRGNLKSAFRLDQTTVLPRHNNPLKLSENTGDSIKQLLVGREGEYLGPRDSVREVCRDLLFHQDAFLDAMTSAFVEFADRFDPDELVQNFDRNIKSTPMLGFMDKYKYWQLYCDLYPVMTEKSGGRFPQMFAEEFVKSYDRQIAEFKRIDPADIAYPPPVLEPLTEEEIEEELKRTISRELENAFDDAQNDPDAGDDDVEQG
ncbi:MAG: type VI secretion system-associated FHA domain protein TagH [Woeseiaceae bacterium]|nr:type VI secretion system-associated FHA domain protein TagH [Woeseiaceae bacterium]